MKFYYGWCIVAISVAVLMVITGTAIHAFGLFVLPVSEAFGLSRAEMNTGIILLNFGMAFASPVIGRILDRRSARLVIVFSALLFGLSLVLLGLSHSPWLSGFVMAVPLAIAVVGCGTLTSMTLVARWFSAKRGRALAIATIGISLGPVIMVPVISLMIGSLGWRDSLILLGVVIGALLLMAVPLIRDRPEPDAQPERTGRPADASAESQQLPGAGFTVASLLRTSQFWMLALSAAFAFGIQQTIVISLVPFAQGLDYSVTQGATLISAFGGMAILGKLLFAWFGDRFDRARLLTILFGLLGLTSGALILANDYPAILACSAFLGLAAGATTPGYLALMADRFGAASFGTASGTAGFITTMVSAACIRYGGEVFDRTGSYRLMFLSFLILGGLSALLMIASRPPAFKPAQAAI